jgi:hypothetical protein
MFESKAPCTCRIVAIAIAIFSFGFSQSAAAQTADDNPVPGTRTAVSSNDEGPELYISWGYNTESYRPVELRMAQPTLGNDFILHAVDYHDSKGWSTGLLSHSVTGPQEEHGLRSELCSCQGHRDSRSNCSHDRNPGRSARR